jgi:hypothetical protein
MFKSIIHVLDQDVRCSQGNRLLFKSCMESGQNNPTIFLVFLSKLLCFSFILQLTQLATFLNVSGG